MSVHFVISLDTFNTYLKIIRRKKIRTDYKVLYSSTITFNAQSRASRKSFEELFFSFSLFATSSMISFEAQSRAKTKSSREINFSLSEIDRILYFSLLIWNSFEHELLAFHLLIWSSFEHELLASRLIWFQHFCLITSKWLDFCIFDWSHRNDLKNHYSRDFRIWQTRVDETMKISRRIQIFLFIFRYSIEIRWFVKIKILFDFVEIVTSLLEENESWSEDFVNLLHYRSHLSLEVDYRMSMILHRLMNREFYCFVRDVNLRTNKSSRIEMMQNRCSQECASSTLKDLKVSRIEKSFEHLLYSLREVLLILQHEIMRSNLLKSFANL